MVVILIDGKGESKVVGSPMPHSNDIIYKDDAKTANLFHDSTVTPRLIMILTTTKTTTTPTTKITAGAIVALPSLSMNQICCMLLSPAISTKSSILSFPGLLG